MLISRKKSFQSYAEVITCMLEKALMKGGW